MIKKIIIIAIVLAVAYFLISRRRKSNEPTFEPISEDSILRLPKCEIGTKLKKGSKCDLVLKAQKQLNQKATAFGFAPLVEDGIFGKKTESALEKVMGVKEATYVQLYTYINLI